jgi:hypothetical protein
MTLPINIKFKVLPRFPAQVIGREGIAVTKQNGIYYFDLDYADFPPQSSIPAGMSPYQLMWDPVSNQYILVNASVTGLADAPNDTNTYGRHALAWVQILPLSGGTMTGPLILQSGTAALGDAPSDGTLYGRKNATWTAVPAGGASVTISDTAPSSGLASGNLWWNSALGQMYIYYNDGTSAQWVAITTAQAVGSGGGGGGGSGGAGSFTTNIVGAGTYIVPSGKTTLVGEAWGSGGGGGSSGSSSKGGGGGGGYSKFTTAVTPGNTVYYNVGTPGGGGNPGTNGGNSWVNPSANSQPAATGCVGGGGGGAGAGVGGGGSGTIGTTNFTGGNGASSGGGGGGCAGSAGNGATATSSTGGAGGSPDGGAGGLGATGSGVNGNIGTTPGGGGGGSVFAGAGGGGNGQVRLTFS